MKNLLLTLFSVLTLSLAAQNSTITVTVNDSSGIPIHGVSVFFYSSSSQFLGNNLANGPIVGNFAGRSFTSGNGIATYNIWNPSPNDTIYWATLDCAGNMTWGAGVFTAMNPNLSGTLNLACAPGGCDAVFRTDSFSTPAGPTYYLVEAYPLREFNRTGLPTNIPSSWTINGLVSSGFTQANYDSVMFNDNNFTAPFSVSYARVDSLCGSQSFSFSLRGTTFVPGCLQAHFPLDGNATDLSANQNHGVIVGTPSATSDRFGNASTAMDFDGSGDYIETNVSYDFQELTASVWFYPTDLTTFQAVMVQDANTLNYGALGVSVLPGGEIAVRGSNFPGMVIDSNVIANQWYHVAIVRRTDSCVFYLNGQQAGVAPAFAGGSSSFANKNLVIGADRNLNRRYFNGKIDDLKILACLSSSSQIDSIYRAGTPVSNLTCNAAYAVDTVNSGLFQNQLIIWETSATNGNIVSYSWDFGDGTTINTQYPSHTYASSGVYPVCLTIVALDSAGVDTCTSTYCDSIGFDANGNLVYKEGQNGFTINVVDPATVGLDELSRSESLAMYPNPAADKVNLSWDAKLNVEKINVYSIAGQRVRAVAFSGNKAEISGLPSGTYLVKVDSKKASNTLRLIVE